MERFRIILVPVVAAAIGGLLGAGQAVAAPVCHTINARGTGQDLGAGRTRADIRGAGLLTGSSEGSFIATPTSDKDVLALTGTVVVTTNDSTVTVSVTGTFDVATGAFRSFGPITGSTGKLAGATGTLTLEGADDLATGAFTETVTGSVCADLRS